MVRSGERDWERMLVSSTGVRGGSAAMVVGYGGGGGASGQVKK